MSLYGMRGNTFKTKKLVVEGKVPVSYTIGPLVGVATSYIYENWNLRDAAAGTALRNKNFAKQPPYPAKIFLYTATAGRYNHSDSVDIYGYTASGKYVKDTVYAHATAAERDYSSNAFAKLTKFVVGATTASTSPSVNFGISSTIGLPWPIASSADLMGFAHGYSHATTYLGAGTSKIKINATYDTLWLPTLTAGSTARVIYLSKFQK
jgi:hypothetical protein